MKESIGNSMIFTIVITFIGIIIMILVGSIAYSKSFKVKNRIVEIIERHAEFHELTSNDWNDNNSALANEIEDSLKKIGYRVTKNGMSNCKQGALNTTSNYEYCVYKHSTSRGPYYEVQVFMYFDLFIIYAMIN